MFDAEEPGLVLNEFLLTLFVPGISLFVLLWAMFRLVLYSFLLSVGLTPIVPADGAGAVAAGYGRFLLLIVLTTVLLALYIAMYRRFIRDSLRARGIV